MASPLEVDLLGKALDRLTEMVVLGMEHVRIGRGISDTAKADPAIAQVAPIFWGLGAVAHLDAAQLAAFKLFDRRNGTVSIHSVLIKAEERKDSFKKATPSQVLELVGSVRVQIASLSASLKRIHQKRNRILAHLDQEVIRNPDQVARQVSVTFSDLDAVLHTAGNILNQISAAYRDLTSILQMIGSEDWKMALKLIADAKCAQIREYERQFGRWEGPRPKDCTPS